MIHTARVDSLMRKIFETTGLGHKTKAREFISYDAVNFFRHTAIERTQAGFDMPEREAHLCCNECCRKRRVHIAWHQHEIALLLTEQLFHRDHDLRGLLCMRATARTEKDIRAWHFEIAEE